MRDVWEIKADELRTELLRHDYEVEGRTWLGWVAYQNGASFAESVTIELESPHTTLASLMGATWKE